MSYLTKKGEYYEGDKILGDVDCQKRPSSLSQTKAKDIDAAIDESEITTAFNSAITALDVL